jgi:hypothetical protein
LKVVPHGKLLLGKLRQKWEDNIKKNRLCPGGRGKERGNAITYDL